MTDTGQIPGEGLPEYAGGQQETPRYADSTYPAGTGPSDQHPHLAHAGQAQQAVHGYPQDMTYPRPAGLPAEEDDLLLMPGTHGAWSEQPAGGTVPGPMPEAEPALRGPQFGTAAAALAHESAPGHPSGPAGHGYPVQGTGGHDAMPQAVAGQDTPAHGTTGYDGAGYGMPGHGGADQGTGSVPGYAAPADHGTVHIPRPATEQPAAAQAEDPQAGAPQEGVRQPAQQQTQPVQQPAPARRPLHMGPPVPESTGGVVRSLADRGPAGTPARRAARTAPGPAAPEQKTPESAGPGAAAPETWDDASPAAPGTGDAAAVAPVAVPPYAEQAAANLPGPQLGQIPAQTAYWGAAVAAPVTAAPEAAAGTASQVMPTAPGAAETPSTDTAAQTGVPGTSEPAAPGSEKNPGPAQPVPAGPVTSGGPEEAAGDTRDQGTAAQGESHAAPAEGEAGDRGAAADPAREAAGTAGAEDTGQPGNVARAADAVAEDPARQADGAGTARQPAAGAGQAQEPVTGPGGAAPSQQAGAGAGDTAAARPEAADEAATGAGALAEGGTAEAGTGHRLPAAETDTATGTGADVEAPPSSGGEAPAGEPDRPNAAGAQESGGQETDGAAGAHATAAQGPGARNTTAESPNGTAQAAAAGTDVQHADVQHADVQHGDDADAGVEEPDTAVAAQGEASGTPDRPAAAAAEDGAENHAGPQDGRNAQAPADAAATSAEATGSVAAGDSFAEGDGSAPEGDGNDASGATASRSAGTEAPTGGTGTRRRAARSAGTPEAEGAAAEKPRSPGGARGRRRRAVQAAFSDEPSQQQAVIEGTAGESPVIDGPVNGVDRRAGRTPAGAGTTPDGSASSAEEQRPAAPRGRRRKPAGPEADAGDETAAQDGTGPAVAGEGTAATGAAVEQQPADTAVSDGGAGQDAPEPETGQAGQDTAGSATATAAAAGTVTPEQPADRTAEQSPQARGATEQPAEDEVAAPAAPGPAGGAADGECDGTSVPEESTAATESTAGATEQTGPTDRTGAAEQAGAAVPTAGATEPTGAAERTSASQQDGAAGQGVAVTASGDGAERTAGPEADGAAHAAGGVAQALDGAARPGDVARGQDGAPAAEDAAADPATEPAAASSGPAQQEEPSPSVRAESPDQPEPAGQAAGETGPGAESGHPGPDADRTREKDPARAENRDRDPDEVPAGPRAPGFGDAEREAVLRVMRERRDIRNGFRTDPIPHEVLLRVLEAAHTAPSVGHSQPWDFVVIRSADTRRAMHELARKQREAYAKSLPKARAKQFKELKIEAILDTPVNIVVTADPTRGGRHTLGRHTQPQMAPYSSALAVENLWLAARAEGLGVGWVSFFDERETVRALGLPEHLEVVAYLCVGYVDEFPPEPELAQAGWSKRRPLSWVVHEETYGRRALPGEDPHDLLQETLQGIRPLDAKALGEAWERQKRMTKPAGALGMLEIISAQLSGLSRKCPPPVPEPAAVAIFAGDHGVHAQGVTPWPQEVTAQMVANFLGGGAVCNAFANQIGAEICVVDVGVAAELPASPGLLPRKVRAGTDDFTAGPAMDRKDVLRALEVGIETARDLVAAGNKALLTGEMGIANTTVSAALVSVFTGQDPAEVTGRGTGINDETHARKIDVVRRALELHQPDPADPLGVLAQIGGLEHAALVGLILGGASLRTPVILDGVSTGAAALVARAIAPESLAACVAGHRSAEPGHVAALTKLGLRPLVDLDLRLGEGTGALLALPVVQSAARAMHEVATFDSAGVTEKS